MCGRYLFDLKTLELEKYYSQLQELGKTGEVFPSEKVLTIATTKNGQISLGLTNWGFTTDKNKSRIINARSETVTEKPLFADSFRRHRCVFPMTGFYEWDNAKNKLLFIPPTDEAIYVGGFYREHQGELESIILTTTPNEVVAPFHNRMPLIIKKADIRSWLKDEQFAIDYLKQSLDTALIVKKSMS